MSVRSSLLRPALAAALLTSAVGLTGCRTVYSVDPTPRTLDEAVAVVGSGPAYLTLRDGRPRPVRDVRLTDSTITYQVGTSVARYTRPRADIVRLSVSKRAGETAAVGYGLFVLAGAVSLATFYRGFPFVNDTDAALGLGVFAAAGALNVAVNPVRRRVLFAAPR